MRAHLLPQAILSAVVLLALAACGSDEPDSVAAPAQPEVKVVEAAAVNPVVPAAPSGTTTVGPSQPLGAGTVSTYVISGPGGEPLEVGVRMSGTSLDNLPMDMAPEAHPTPMILTLPSGVSGGVLNHVQFYWNPMGHPPMGVWNVPHFDFHFYMVDPAVVQEINPANAEFTTKAVRLPEPKYVPVDFMPEPGESIQNTIPGMGLHWVDKTENLDPATYKFSEIMINGSWNGKHIFIEPMITREWLLGHNQITEPLKLPSAYQTAGRWPTTYTVRYDATKSEWSIALGGFADRLAS